MPVQSIEPLRIIIEDLRRYHIPYRIGESNWNITALHLVMGPVAYNPGDSLIGPCDNLIHILFIDAFCSGCRILYIKLSQFPFLPVMRSA